MRVRSPRDTRANVAPGAAALLLLAVLVVAAAQLAGALAGTEIAGGQVGAIATVFEVAAVAVPVVILLAVGAPLLVLLSSVS